jgi:hypothetical protein
VNIVDNSIKKNESNWIVRPITDKIQEGLDALASTMSDSHQDMMNHLSTTPFQPMKSIAFKMNILRRLNIDYRISIAFIT